MRNSKCAASPANTGSQLPLRSCTLTRLACVWCMHTSAMPASRKVSRKAMLFE
jgi:hypothetical protein